MLHGALCCCVRPCQAALPQGQSFRQVIVAPLCPHPNAPHSQAQQMGCCVGLLPICGGPLASQASHAALGGAAGAAGLLGVPCA